MDPNELLSKIEAGHLWAYFHKDWLLEMRQRLRPQLPPQYHVFVESESLLISPELNEPPAVTLPDLSVARGRPGVESVEASAAPRGTTALIELDEPCELVTRYSLLIRRAPENHVVAALELLSPSNKGIASRLDRQKYLRKRESFLEAGVNFLEMDALREGERALPASLHNLGSRARNAWTAFHHQRGRRIRGYGWNANEPLPTIDWWQPPWIWAQRCVPRVSSIGGKSSCDEESLDRNTLDISVTPIGPVYDALLIPPLDWRLDCKHLNWPCYTSCETVIMFDFDRPR